MFFESAQLPVCSLLVLYSTAHVRGGCWKWLGAKRACQFVPHALFIALFFTEVEIFYKKLVVAFRPQNRRIALGGDASKRERKLVGRKGLMRGGVAVGDVQRVGESSIRSRCDLSWRLSARRR